MGTRLSVLQTRGGVGASPLRLMCRRRALTTVCAGRPPASPEQHRLAHGRGQGLFARRNAMTGLSGAPSTFETDPPFTREDFAAPLSGSSPEGQTPPPPYTPGSFRAPPERDARATSLSPCPSYRSDSPPHSSPRPYSPESRSHVLGGSGSPGSPVSRQRSNSFSRPEGSSHSRRPSDRARPFALHSLGSDLTVSFPNRLVSALPRSSPSQTAPRPEPVRPRVALVDVHSASLFHLSMPVCKSAFCTQQARNVVGPPP